MAQNLGYREHLAAKVAVFLLFAALFSRGLGEVLASKGLVMVLQLMTTAMILVFLGVIGHTRGPNEPMRRYLLLALPFLGVVACSVLLTMTLDYPYWAVYFTFTSFLLGLVLCVAKDYGGTWSQLPFAPIAIRWGWILLAVALLEQIGLVSMPGSSRFFVIVRPASLTGSFLHYPILMAVLGFIALQRRDYLAGTLFCLAPFGAASRSGMFIVLCGFLLVLWLNLIRGRPRGAIVGLAVLACLGTTTLIMNPQKNTVAGRLWSRVTTASSSKAEGNVGRISSWSRGVKMWSDTNLWFGEHTGKITNSTGKLFDGETDVVESGLIQQMVNYGLLGMLLFYAILFFVFGLVNREHVLLRGGYLAGVTQTLFYQSIEVVPYIVLLLLFPVISQVLIQEKPNGSHFRRGTLCQSLRNLPCPNSGL